MSAIRAADSEISGGRERDVLADTNNLSDVSGQKAGRMAALWKLLKLLS
jgi:hypothetical protein